jgi:multidrug efflux pump subunit AcrB
VIDAIRSANQDVAAGRVTSPTRELVGKTAGKFRSVKDVETVLLPVTGGGRVPLTEVATVRDTHREQRLWARLDGTPAVRMTIRKQPNANTVQVAEDVDARLKSLAGSQFIPGDVTYRVISNQADFIRNSWARGSPCWWCSCSWARCARPSSSAWPSPSPSWPRSRSWAPAS